MSKGYNNDDYDFGTDPEFEKKFLMNIERVLSDVDKDISIRRNPLLASEATLKGQADF